LYFGLSEEVIKFSFLVMDKNSSMKIKILSLLVFAAFIFGGFATTAEAGYVNGYYRSNGTYVNGYWRSEPNGLKYDNYSWTSGDDLYNDSYYDSGYDSNWYTPSYTWDSDYYTGYYSNSDFDNYYAESYSGYYSY
jgi:hypothetical protein